MKLDFDQMVSGHRIHHILESFSTPQTPAQIEKKLSIKKLKTVPFLEAGLLKCLTPDTKKGRIYVLSENARKFFKLPDIQEKIRTGWGLVGWVAASPRQRWVLLKTIAVDSRRWFSEDLRKRAAKYNPRMTRVSTKEVLNELVSKGLVETKLDDGKRFYWVSELGRSLYLDISEIGLL